MKTIIGRLTLVCIANLALLFGQIVEAGVGEQVPIESETATRKEIRKIERKVRQESEKARIEALNKARKEEFNRFKVRGSLGVGATYETGNQFVVPEAPVQLVEDVITEIGSLSEALSHPIRTSGQVEDLAEQVASDVEFAEEVRDAATEFVDASRENFEQGQYSTTQLQIRGDARLDWKALSAGTDGAISIGTSAGAPKLSLAAKPFVTGGIQAAGVGAFGNVSTGPSIQTIAFGPGLRLANTAFILDPICQITPIGSGAGAADDRMICGEIRSLPGRMTETGSERPFRATGEMIVGVNPETFADGADFRSAYANGAFGVEAKIRPRHRTT
ncbi:MAG: hypothetical protein AAB425_05720, partial [Bdellovibrionota bacterium]